jgi:glycosyltransferase involved in cell wall biosynthesis
MSESTNSKNILIISYGPVPTPEFQKIEGGGMRCWGLALGLKANGHNVTVSVKSEFVQGLDSYRGIHLHNWDLNDNFKTYINSFDAVIISYSMGDMSVFVADNLSHHITLVLDCYVPIFIEISARDSDDKAGELRGYLHEIKRFNHVLERGDFFLCANEPQKHMYAGILGSLGVINPYSYRQHRVLVVPFGVETESISKATQQKSPYEVAKSKDFVLLWFGGLYPWFNFEPLIDAVKELSSNPRFKFYLVGGKNPYNSHPDFVKQYEYVYKKFSEYGLVGKSVFFVDWIDFDDRIRWYVHADLVISINSPGEENVYSWRTRVMDYLWGELPMMSNGGDPLSDELLTKNAAVKTEVSSAEIAKNISRLINTPHILVDLKKNLLRVKEQYYWPKVTEVLSDQLNSKNSLPYVEGLSFMEEHKIDSRYNNAKRKPVIDKAKKVKSYATRAKQKGIKRSAKFALGIARAQISGRTSSHAASNSQKVFFLSHPIDHTGAPLVLLDIINDFGKVYDHSAIHIVAPAIERDLLNPLLTKKYKIHKMAAGVGGRIIQAGLQIKPEDIVLMNTVALYQNYKDYVYWMLETGKLKHAFWFIHEDNPLIRFGNKKEISRIKRLLADKKMTILVPSQQTAGDYKSFFETNSVKPITLRVQVPEKLQKPRSAEDFETIKFFISGIPLDGRKAQLLFLSALQLFEAKYKAKNPDNYRTYTLDLVAIGTDYVSQQINSIGEVVLGKNMNIHPILNRKAALEITRLCNVTVCSSLNETFALFVAEGMLMHHTILRNRTSGWQEQIVDGENGFLFNTLSVDELADCVERLLNKKLSNEALQAMGKASFEIAQKFSHADYQEQISSIEI